MIAEAVTTIALAGLVYLILRRVSVPMMPGESRPPPVRKRETPPPASELDVLFAQAEEQLKAGKYDEAEKRLLSLERRQPHYPKLYNRLGIAYLEQGDYQRAVEAFERAVREDPQKASRHANLGMAYLQINKYSLAKKSLERAVELDPANEKYQRLLEEIKNR